jgi:hypothetical protein
MFCEFPERQKNVSFWNVTLEIPLSGVSSFSFYSGKCGKLALDKDQTKRIGPSFAPSTSLYIGIPPGPSPGDPPGRL